MKQLTGAAKAAHQKRVALDFARNAIRRRDPLAVTDTLVFLRAAAATEPTRRAL